MLLGITFFSSDLSIGNKIQSVWNPSNFGAQDPINPSRSQLVVRIQALQNGGL